MVELHGITLPDFPTEISISEYPYMILMQGEEDGVATYTALLTSKPMYYNPTTNLYGHEVPYNNALCSTYDGLDTWAILGGSTVTEPSESEFPIGDGVYSNYDIMNIETGEIHLKSYDGVLLPPLPSDIDRTVYPYASVFKLINTSANLTMYMFVVTDVPTQYSVEKGYWLPSGTKMTAGMLQTIENGWENVFAQVNETDMYLNEQMQGFETTLIWSEVAEEKLYSIKESTLKNIANSIRTKTGGAELITPINMPSEIEGISSGVNVNLLINGDFQIWTEGESYTTQNNGKIQYTADQWAVNSAVTTITKVENGLKIVGDTYILQPLERALEVGKTYTVSYSKNGEISMAQIVGGTHTDTFVNGVKYGTVSGFDTIMVMLTSGDILNWVKLEYGNIATPFVPRFHEEELELCKRYFYWNKVTTSVLLPYRNGKTMLLGIYDKEMRLTSPDASIKWCEFYMPDASATSISSITISDIRCENKRLSFNVNKEMMSGAAAALVDARLDARIY